MVQAGAEEGLEAVNTRERAAQETDSRGGIHLFSRGQIGADVLVLHCPSKGGAES